jgi:hypothetical protein
MSAWEEYKAKHGSTPLDLLNPKTKPALSEVADERYSICKNCPQFLKMSKRCKECGCFMKLKTQISSSKCPIGKW